MIDTDMLRTPHRAYPDGCSWCLTDEGISIDGAAPLGTPGIPLTVTRVWTWFGAEIRAASQEFGVPVEAIVATICAESAGSESERDGAVNSTRHEPGYVSDEETPSRVSIGCMQTLISTARDALHQPALTGDDLRVALTSIRAGVAYIAGQAGSTHLDPPKIAAAYNAGSLREDGDGNPWRMVCYPIGTGAHVTRWTKFFNDAFLMSRGRPHLWGDGSSYTALD